MTFPKYGVYLLVALVSSTFGSPLSAQSRTLRACTPDVIAACADLRFTSGVNSFDIAVRGVGSTGNTALPLSFYNFVFSTGNAPAISPVANLIAPIGGGGAVVSDTSPWEVFDTGDFLFLSALSNRGVGGCVAGADQGGFGQAITTCSNSEFALFTFTPLMSLNPSLFSIANLEAVVLTSDLRAASCGADDAPCVISNIPSDVTTTPEPGTVCLLALSLLILVPVARRGVK